MCMTANVRYETRAEMVVAVVADTGLIATVNLCPYDATNNQSDNAKRAENTPKDACTTTPIARR
jgi:hypothetical protein